MEDANIRLECLKFAMQLGVHGDSSPKTIMENSEKFYAFVVAKRSNASPEEG